MKLEVFNYNINDWKYLYSSYYKFGTLVESYSLLENISLNTTSNSPVELLLYNLNLQEVPKVMNIMAKQKSYGLDKVIGMKSMFSTTEFVDGNYVEYQGMILKIFIPNFFYEGTEKVDFNYGVSGSEFLILDSTKNISNPVASLTNESSEVINNRLYGLIHESIVESDHKRVFTAIIGSKNANKLAEISVHKAQKFNEHQGQSALTYNDLREGTYISKLFQSIISTDRRLSCISNTCISGDFTKQYLGSNYVNNVPYLITADTKEELITDDGQYILYL